MTVLVSKHQSQRKIDEYMYSGTTLFKDLRINNSSSLIRTHCLLYQLHVSTRKSVLQNKDTSLIQTLHVVTMVSAIEKFHYSYNGLSSINGMCACTRMMGKRFSICQLLYVHTEQTGSMNESSYCNTILF